MIPAITLYQPYATLVAIGAKPYETRDYAPPEKYISRRIAIHAARRPIRSILGKLGRNTVSAMDEKLGQGWVTRLPLGVVVCTARLAGAYRVESIDPHRPSRRSIGQVATFSDLMVGEHIEADAFGDYSEGRWCWHLTDIELVEPAVPAKGYQGWWKWGEAA